MRLREIKILQDTPSSFFGITMPLLKQEGRGGDKKKKSNINFTMCREVKKKNKNKNSNFQLMKQNPLDIYINHTNKDS